MTGPNQVDQLQRLVELICAQPLIAERYKNLKPRPDTRDGRFSLVMDADDTRTGELVVLKFLNPQEPDPYRRRSFVREAEILAKFVGRDNVVQLRGELTSHQLNLEDKGTGIVLQIPLNLFSLERANESLATYLLTRTNPPQLLRRLDILRDVVKGVNRLHHHGYCHRDLKLGNVLLFPGGFAKLGDLGTCRPLDDAQRLAGDYLAPVGDLGFAAPELFFGSGNDPKSFKGSDWFSLGGMIFETVANTNLYVAIGLKNEDLIEMMKRYYMLPPTQRIQQFLKIAETIAGQYPLPSLKDYLHLPWLAEERPETLSSFDNLLISLCHFDFRKRTTAFEDILRRVDICRGHARLTERARALRGKR